MEQPLQLSMRIKFKPEGGTDNERLRREKNEEQAKEIMEKHQVARPHVQLRPPHLSVSVHDDTEMGCSLMTIQVMSSIIGDNFSHRLRANLTKQLAASSGFHD